MAVGVDFSIQKKTQNEAKDKTINSLLKITKIIKTTKKQVKQNESSGRRSGDHKQLPTNDTY